MLRGKGIQWLRKARSKVDPVDKIDKGRGDIGVKIGKGQGDPVTKKGKEQRGSSG